MGTRAGVNESQQESRLNDRGNLISNTDKSERKAAAE